MNWLSSNNHHAHGVRTCVFLLDRSVHAREGRRRLGAAGDGAGLRHVQHAQPGPAAPSRRRRQQQRQFGAQARPVRPVLLHQQRRGPVPEGPEAVHNRDGGSPADDDDSGTGRSAGTRLGVPAGAVTGVGLGARERACSTADGGCVASRRRSDHRLCGWGYWGFGALCRVVVRNQEGVACACVVFAGSEQLCERLRSKLVTAMLRSGSRQNKIYSL